MLQQEASEDDKVCGEVLTLCRDLFQSNLKHDANIIG